MLFFVAIGDWSSESVHMDCLVISEDLLSCFVRQLVLSSSFSMLGLNLYVHHRSTNSAGTSVGNRWVPFNYFNVLANYKS